VNQLLPSQNVLAKAYIYCGALAEIERSIRYDQDLPNAVASVRFITMLNRSLRGSEDMLVF
jgi:hypothetical protein